MFKQLTHYWVANGNRFVLLNNKISLKGRQIILLSTILTRCVVSTLQLKTFIGLNLYLLHPANKVYQHIEWIGEEESKGQTFNDVDKIIS